MEKLRQINKSYRYSEYLSAGGQPTTAQFELLKQSGVEVIINLSPASTKNALREEYEVVESLKILLQIQQPEDKWFVYFKKMGMQGLNLMPNYESR
jgi:hypothetical protein